MLNKHEYENFMRLVISHAAELAKNYWEEEAKTLRDMQFLSGRNAGQELKQSWGRAEILATFYNGKKDARWQVIMDLEEFLQARLEQLDGEK